MNDRRVIVATKNKGKIIEIASVCSDLPISFIPLNTIMHSDETIEETASTFEGNARIKASWVYSKTGQWTLADDSGLEVDALSGRPGVRSARYAASSSDAQRTVTDAENVEKLLSELVAVPPALRTARFRCVLVLMGPDGFEKTVEGCCEGSIGFTPMGVNGFGYDPVFIPADSHLTLGQMDLPSKNLISHRGLALRRLKEVLHAIVW
ncbi:MAG: RdgB/HAM1 family non-canonical purine NTP pyrophosphatase [Chitinivibrionales bacterium]|nr:RdgB/HAM1 family non-canonical purine NTP pyrophosphatase [Chitinivibrionales bacterium]